MERRSGFKSPRPACPPATPPPSGIRFFRNKIAKLRMFRSPAADGQRVPGPRTVLRNARRRWAVERAVKRPSPQPGGARGWALQPRVVYLEYGGEGGAWKPPRVPFPPLVFAPDSPCWTQTEEPGAAAGGSGPGAPGGAAGRAACSPYRPPPFPAQGGNQSRDVNSGGNPSLACRSGAGPRPGPPAQPSPACARRSSRPASPGPRDC